MTTGATSPRFLVCMLLVIAMLTVACGSDSNTEEIAAIVKDAVAAGQTGPSAADIRKSVQDAVAAAAPASVDPTEITRTVEAAIARQAGAQMTAADVKKVVDAAIAAGLMLGVVDNHNSGIGGGCFILIRRADGKLLDESKVW